MVIRQPLLVFPTLPSRQRRRFTASGVAIALSIGVHAVVGLYLVQMTFHPLTLAEPKDPVILDGATVTLVPSPPQTLKPPPPHMAIHRSAHSTPADTATLDAQPTPAQPNETAQTAVIPFTPTTPEVSPNFDPPSTPVVISNPAWLARPGAGEMARAYPAVALRRGVGGSATLLCAVLANGAVSGCAIQTETPSGAGFGKAALSLTRYFRMRPRLENGAAVGGAMVQIPIRFVMPTD
ncbi:MAG TPA: TonB family protein [Caulobacteraceae bacterium]|nr:TonB family protein [Caulobacteraceae bacterium]